MDLESKTVVELKILAKEAGLTGYSSMTWGQLVDVLSKKKRVGKKIVGVSKRSKGGVSKTSKSQSAINKIKPISKISPTNNSWSDDCITQSKMKLNPHQIRVVKAFKFYKSILAYHQMGSGKTLTSMASAMCFLKEYPEGKVICATTKSLLNNFREGLLNYFGYNLEKPGVFSSSTIKKVDELMETHFEIYTFTGLATKVSSRSLKKPTMIIIDEAHNLRSGRKSSRASAIIDLIATSKNIKKVLLLTGTALYNDPYDTASLMAIVRGEKPLTKTQFEVLLQPENAQKLKDYVGCGFSLYTVDRHSHPDYPSYKIVDTLIEMNSAYYKVYSEIENRNIQALLEIGYSDKDPWKFLTGLRQAVNKGLTKGCSCPKCDRVIDILKGRINLSGKVTNTKSKKKMLKSLVYSSFRECGVELLKERLEEEGITYREITGDTTTKTRNTIVKDYNSDKYDVLLITNAGGEGIDLKSTRRVILYEAMWNDASEEQIWGRAVRYKSHSHLPENERNVIIYKLGMIKPKHLTTGQKNSQKTDRQKIKSMLSADQRLIELAAEKAKKNAIFLKTIEPFSIENNTKICSATTSPKVSKVAVSPKNKISYPSKKSSSKRISGEKTSAKKVISVKKIPKSILKKGTASIKKKVRIVTP